MTLRLHTIALFLLGLLPLAASAEIRLDTPRAGWRQGSAEGAHFVQQVNYPASSVNSAPDQADTARILGQIKNTAKVDAGAPARLIVNGISMPLKVQEDGGFDRPFVFPAGSNNVEVRSADGQQVRRVQFYNQGSGETPAKLRVVLSWDSDNTDLDLHVISPDGQHVFYGARQAANGGALDVDVTTGFGPEIFATPSPLPGTYLVFVNYFGAGELRDIISTAQLTVVQEEGTPREKQQTFRVPLRKPGELTQVAAFRVGG